MSAVADDVKEVIVYLEHDQDIECPSEWDGWKLKSFNTRHNSFAHPDEFTGRNGWKSDIKQMLKSGRAFILSYYEHGQCSWFLSGEDKPGVEYQWDGVRVAGLLIWEHDPKFLPRGYEKRKELARGFCETYTAWANGEGYYYSVEDTDGNHLDSCGGFYGNDVEYMFEQIRHATEGYAIGAVNGDASWLSNWHDLGGVPQ